MLHRRDLLKAGMAASVAMGLPRVASAQTEFAPRPGEWRSFAVTSRIEIARPNGKTQVWLPLPSVHEIGLVSFAWQRMERQRLLNLGAGAKLRRADASGGMGGRNRQLRS